MERLGKLKGRYSESCTKQDHDSEGIYRNPGALMTNPEPGNGKESQKFFLQKSNEGR